MKIGSAGLKPVGKARKQRAANHKSLRIGTKLQRARLLLGYLPDIPTRKIVATPTSFGFEYEPLKITTEDGVTLDAWFAAQAARDTLLFFHGNAGKRQSRDYHHHSNT